MAQRRLFPLALAAFGLFLALIALGLVITNHAARALPAAGTDNVYVSADVSLASRIGTETIHLKGTATIVREDPHLESGMEVENLQITALNLTGHSQEGDVTVSQSQTTHSTGQIRSVNPSPQQFPAQSFFDVFIDVQAPASPSPILVLHNEASLHLAPVSGTPINAWPPFGVTYEMNLSQQPTPTPTSNPAPPDTPPCANGIRLAPEFPAETCVTAASFALSLPPTLTPTMTPCVPTCTPTATSTLPTSTPTRTPRPTAIPTHTPGPTAEQSTVFSVARNGPSGFDPGALLSRSIGGLPVPIAGNDNFANAWQVNTSSFTGTESTFGMTTEAGEPFASAPNPVPLDYCISTPPNYMGDTAWFRYTPGASGDVTIDTNGSDFDTVLAVYTGSALNALTLVGCDDDSGSGFQSLVTFIASAGTTYYVQAGGFSGEAGQLLLNIAGAGSAGTSGVHEAVSCAHLGLIGCNGATRDDIDALSFGHDFVPGTGSINFSVGPGSVGAAGSAVAQQAACSPPEPQADEFSSARNGANSLLLDGDGQSDGCPTATGLGLIERPTSDNLDAIAGEPPSVVDTNGDGLLDEPVFFSLAAGSPTLAALGRSTADILWTVGFQPGLYASAAQLGLQLADDIDAVCIADHGSQSIYEPGIDKVLFSLAPGSPTLATLGASAADVLAPGPKIAVHAWELGLAPGDNLDAMSCHSISAGPAVTIPVGDIWFCNASFGPPPPGLPTVCDTTIQVGETVTWDFTGAAALHTTTECGASCDNPVPLAQAQWDSGILGAGAGTFSHTFTTPGTYLYYCRVHPAIHRGRIIVQGVGTPTPTPARHYGDANNDGTINSIDAALVLQYSAGLLHSINPNADANGNGQINAIDATLILQYVAGLLHNLPP